jgi:hypothetical protein
MSDVFGVNIADRPRQLHLSQTTYIFPLRKARMLPN